MKHVLTPEEKCACLMLGVITKGAELCLPVRVLSDAICEKRAGVIGATAGATAFMAKSVITAAVLTGLPLGIASHLVGKKLKSRDKKERELELRRNYYAEAARGLEQGLPELED